MLKRLLLAALLLLPGHAWAMQKHLGYATDNAGNVVSTTSVRVKIAGSNTDATIYSDNGVTQKLNPFDVESSDGSYYFYAANGKYDIILTSPDATFDSDDTADVVLFDHADASNIYSVKDYGLKGDGVTDDGPALQGLINIIAATSPPGGTILFPSPGRYRIATCLQSGTLGNYFTVQGDMGAVISKECNGVLFPVVNGASVTKWKDLNIDANGDEYTGAIWYLGTFSTQLEFSGLYVHDAGEVTFLIADVGGCEMSIHDSVFYIHSSIVDNGTSAIVKSEDDDFEVDACPRQFHHNFGLAHTFFARVNGWNGGYFDQIYSSGVEIGDNCVGCQVYNSRHAVPTGQTLHVSGNSTIFTGNLIGGNITVDAGFIYGQFVNNILAQGVTFTDNSIKTGLATQPLVEDPSYAIGRQIVVIATADLPAAGASMNGRVIIEDAGAGDRNLIIYAGGQRFRIDGGTAF